METLIKHASINEKRIERFIAMHPLTPSSLALRVEIKQVIGRILNTPMHMHDTLLQHAQNFYRPFALSHFPAGRAHLLTAPSKGKAGIAKRIIIDATNHFLGVKDEPQQPAPQEQQPQQPAPEPEDDENWLQRAARDLPPLQ